jgi:hypothetical protein
VPVCTAVKTEAILGAGFRVAEADGKDCKAALGC